MQHTKIVLVDQLQPLNLRPIVVDRIDALKKSIAKNGYDSACPLVIQANGNGFVVVNGCHRLQAVIELDIKEVPVVEYPGTEDPVKLALWTQENAEETQRWDFLDKAFLCKKLCQELGTQEKVVEKLGWSRANISYLIKISELSEEIFTLIRKSVITYQNLGREKDFHGREKYNMEDLWKATWFRYICALPVEELKLTLIKKIAENPLRWKEKDVASECSKVKKRYETTFLIKDLIGRLNDQDDRETIQKLNELIEAVASGSYDKQIEVAMERAEAIIKTGQRTDIELLDEWGYAPIPYDVWKFNGRDARFGNEYPGNIPAGIIFEVLYFFTQQGDLVIDPMAGGGVAGDVCKSMKRKCLMYDVIPCREDIKEFDFKNGWPEEAKNPELVFLDPPYYKKKQSEYSEKSISSLPKKQYLEFFENLAVNLKKAGARKVAFLMSDYNNEDSLLENIFIWDYVPLFIKAGFVPVRHIMVPLNEQAVHPDIVIKFRKNRKLARLGRSLVIFTGDD